MAKMSWRHHGEAPVRWGEALLVQAYGIISDEVRFLQSLDADGGADLLDVVEVYKDTVEGVDVNEHQIDINDR